MKLETLKELIKAIPTKLVEEEEIINSVLKLLDLYEQDNNQPANPIPPPYPIPRDNKGVPLPNPTVYPRTGDDLVRYGEICSCNPKNGGSGICGCVMGNELIPRSSGKSTFQQDFERCQK
jgi:hypothetical protein